MPVALLDAAFLLVLALAIAATSQLTGALLVFALLVAPPAAAQQLTLRPVAGLVLSVVFALLTIWLALAIAYFTIYPVGFYVTTIGFAIYLDRAPASHALMFAHEFVRNAWLAGTFIALACGVIGWFVVARAQVFAGDALSHVAFVGAIAAAAVGVDERVGLFALTLALAGAMGALGRRAQADDVTIGITFAWILGIGVLLLAILATSAGGASGITTADTLFGSVYSLSAGAAVVAAAVAFGAVAFVVAAARPLLLATLDPELATLRGIPVRALGLGFLAALAVVTRREHPGGRRAAAARPHRRAGRRRARPDGTALPGPRALGRDRGGGDVGRPGAQLRDQRAAGEHRRHRPGGGRLRGRRGLVAAEDQRRRQRVTRGPAGMLRRESWPEPPPVPQVAGRQLHRWRRGAHSSQSRSAWKGRREGHGAGMPWSDPRSLRRNGAGAT